MGSIARTWAGRLLPAAAALAVVSPFLAAPSAAEDPDPATGHLYLVALDGTGAPTGSAATRRTALVQRQDAALAAVGASSPLYRWTHALNGFAVRLDADQAADLAGRPDVAAVERAAVRRLAGAPSGGSELPGSPYAPGHGGRGTVIGLVDSGLAPDNPVFASTGLGPRPRGFTGDCDSGEGWGSVDCNGKVVAAHWFVRGFGEDRLASSASLSPRDDVGHGTQVASLAAGNAGVSIELKKRQRGDYSGVAPRARLAVYKACWTAPDPANDGCSTADLVSAVDKAVADRVDVLNLSVDGSGEYDVLARALLGAAEADVVAVAAAGSGRTVAHPEPWVTTVGATNGTALLGSLELASGRRLDGAMLSARAGEQVRLVRGADVAAPGSSRADARTCRPGSLDDRVVDGALVVCERGEIGRVDKSAAVRRAGGVGMVLLNGRGSDEVFADLHDVPTVHLHRAESRVLRSWLASHPRGRARLVSTGPTEQPARVLRHSAPGDPSATILKPDVVAPGTGLLGATPPGADGARWDFLTGTSAASAQVAGLAAVLRARHDWPAARIRSVLATSTRPVAARAVRRGSGEATRDLRPGLAFDVPPGNYRAFLAGEVGRALNTPSVKFGAGHGTAVRRVTNVSGRTRTWSATVSAFDTHVVRVVPSTVRLRPGRSAQVRIVADGPPGPHASDQGLVTWRSAGTADVRVPVVLDR